MLGKAFLNDLAHSFGSQTSPDLASHSQLPVCVKELARLITRPVTRGGGCRSKVREAVAILLARVGHVLLRACPSDRKGAGDAYQHK
jgi:hypothetical protein